MDACRFIWLVWVRLFAFICLYVVVIWYLCIDCLAVLFNALVWVVCGVGFRWNLLFVGFELVVFAVGCNLCIGCRATASLIVMVLLFMMLVGYG